MEKRKAELLAPAGSFESMCAAIEAGCDAVYMGGELFGARAYADNPKGDRLIEAIDYAHLRGVKLYLTVNTLLKDRETDKLYGYLFPLYVHGLDGVIVQDYGVMALISKMFPDLPIHLSTQAAVTGAAGASVLSERFAPGVTRVVPARELTLDEVRALVSESGLEVEVFIHGAMCYGCSGQCLMSSMIGGRSGNRGRCAQPCRRLYTDENGRTSYILSHSDMCTLPILHRILAAGAHSLKIEGRMKSPSYTAGVTAIYRKYVDFYYAKGYEAYEKLAKEYNDPGLRPASQMNKDMECLLELYNRGSFCTGGYEGRKGPKMVMTKRPNHLGLRVGTVKSVSKDSVVITPDHELEHGDVLEISRELSPVYEFTLGEAKPAGREFKANYKRGLRILSGDEVYRTRNAVLIDEIDRMYVSSRKPIGIDGEIKVIAGEPVTITYSFGNVTATVTGNTAEPAKTSGMTKERLASLLAKLGSTEFGLVSPNAITDGNSFAPVGELNELRRKAVSKLREKILSGFSRPDPKYNSDDALPENPNPCGKVRKSPGLSCLVSDLSQLEAVICNKEAALVYLDCTMMSHDDLTEGIRMAKNSGVQVFAALPHIARKPVLDGIKILVTKCIDAGADGFLVRNLEELTVIPSGTSVHTDYTIYGMNSFAVGEIERMIRDCNAKDIAITIPRELNEQEIRELLPSISADASMIVYGFEPVMFTNQCIRRTNGDCRQKPSCGTITDEKGKSFTYRTVCDPTCGCGTDISCKLCYNVIYNSDRLCIADRILNDDLQSSSPFSTLSFLRYDFTFESPDEIREILNGNYNGPYTREHFKRGVE